MIQNLGDEERTRFVELAHVTQDVSLEKRVDGYFI